MEKLNKYILQKALESGICQPGALELGKSNGREDMLKMYVKGIDFCLSKNFPSNADLVSLGGNLLAGYGIYVDAEVGEPRDFMVLLGACKAHLAFGDYSVAQLFVKHKSTAHVTVQDNAFVVIDCFETSTLHVDASGNSKVLINVYGDAKVISETIVGEGQSAIIKIIHKNKATY